MCLTIAYSKIKKQNLVLINNDTHQRETVSERPIRPPLRTVRTNGQNMLNGHQTSCHKDKCCTFFAQLNVGFYTVCVQCPRKKETQVQVQNSWTRFIGFQKLSI